jgi:hypothetical protein
MKTTLLFTLALLTFGNTSNALGFSLWEGNGFFPAALEPVPPGHGLNKLLTMSSDRDTLTTELSAMINSTGEVAGLYSSPPKSSYFEGKEEGRNVFWLSEIESEDGALMLEAQGKKVLFLEGRLNRETQEGKFRVRFLTNGLFGRYSTCDFHLRKNGNSWFVENAYTGRRVSQVKVITHSLGITTLQGFCPEKQF